MKRFLLIGLLCTTSAFINGQTKNEVEEEANQVIERFSKGLVPFDVDFLLRKMLLGMTVILRRFQMVLCMYRVVVESHFVMPFINMLSQKEVEFAVGVVLVLRLQP